LYASGAKWEAEQRALATRIDSVEAGQRAAAEVQQTTLNALQAIQSKLDALGAGGRQR
jgi:hypothetical protein